MLDSFRERPPLVVKGLTAAGMRSILAMPCLRNVISV